jgi:hypothetical protein
MVAPLVVANSADGNQWAGADDRPRAKSSSRRSQANADEQTNTITASPNNSPLSPTAGSVMPS